MLTFSSHLSCILTLMFFCVVSHGQSKVSRDSAQGDSNLSNLDHFHLQWPDIAVSTPVGNPYLGGQNLTYCCIKALNDYLGNGHTNTSQVQVDERIFEPHASFPCNASWIGDAAGIPVVQVSYLWAIQHCPGWQMSNLDASRTKDWAALSWFIIPIIMFSLNIPIYPQRDWKMARPTNNDSSSIFADSFKLLPTAVRATIDAIVRVVTTIIFAGPLLLSGLYEARLDVKALNFLENCIEHHQLPLAMRARLILTLVYGNLPMYPIRGSVMKKACDLDMLDREDMTTARSHQPAPLVATGQTLSDKYSTPVDRDVYLPLKKPLVPFYPRTQVRSTIENLKSVTKEDIRTTRVRVMEVRLKTIIALRNSVTLTFWLPTLFLIGSLIYVLLDIESSSQLEYATLVLFGCWLTILPHVPTVNGLLSIGNDYDPFKYLLGSEHNGYMVDEDLTRNTPKNGEPISNVINEIHDTKHKSSWIRGRGKNKNNWLVLLFIEAWAKYEKDLQPTQTHIKLARFLNEAVIMSLPEWIIIWMSALLLTFLPCFFGLLIYYNSETSKTCHLFTIFTYMGSQTLLMVVWTFHLTWRNKYWVLERYLDNIVRESLMVTNLASKGLRETIDQLRNNAKEHIEYLKSYEILANMNSHVLSTLNHRYRKVRAYKTAEVVFQLLFIIGLFMSVLSSIGGPLMETIGLYRCAVCLPTVTQWDVWRQRSTFLRLSADSLEHIYEVNRYQRTLAYCNVGLLIYICLIGWSFQRRFLNRIAFICGDLSGNLTKNNQIDMHKKLPGGYQAFFTTLTQRKVGSEDDMIPFQRFFSRTIFSQLEILDSEDSRSNSHNKTSGMESVHNFTEDHQVLPTQGPQLVTWTCSCGQKLSDYYSEKIPGAVAQLQLRLQREHARTAIKTFSASNFVSSLLGHRGSSQIAADASINNTENATTASGSSSQGKTSSSSPPSSQPPLLTTSVPINPSQILPPNSYLLLCFPEKFSGLKLHHEQIARPTSQPSSNHPITCDRELFEQLQRIYQSTRNVWFHKLWPRTVTRVSLAYFLVDSEKYVELKHYACQADHMSCNSIPPANNVHYHFTPRDPPYRPPIAPNYLTHYFQNPDCIKSSNLTVTLNQIPKRLSECLANSGSTRIEGWGLEFEEGWHQGRVQKWAVILIVMGAIVFLILWWILEKDVQGAAGIASFLVGSLAAVGYLMAADQRMIS